ncbi:MAG: hypothetical protein IKX16_02965, partial [Clostridia bacterium]|nr:hypothetical protein [Clostridia bacterium]
MDRRLYSISVRIIWALLVLAVFLNAGCSDPNEQKPVIIGEASEQRVDISETENAGQTEQPTPTPTPT